MTTPLRAVRVGLLEREGPPGSRLVDSLLPALRRRGARVDVVAAERGAHRLDRDPGWDLVVLKSGSAAALHLAAAAGAWGAVVVNTVSATRLTQDKVASMLLLRSRGLPIPPCRALWGGGSSSVAPSCDEELRGRGRRLVVKAGRGSGGRGVWWTPVDEAAALLSTLEPGPYLVMDDVEHEGDDLKVYVAGSWVRGVSRAYPAQDEETKRGRAVPVPSEVLDVVGATGRALGLTCFGCDLVKGPDGWPLFDVNAFPGYKGTRGAGEAVAEAVSHAWSGSGTAHVGAPA